MSKVPSHESCPACKRLCLYPRHTLDGKAILVECFCGLLGPKANTVFEAFRLWNLQAVKLRGVL